jgi:hypothetical protein
LGYQKESPWDNYFQNIRLSIYPASPLLFPDQNAGEDSAEKRMAFYLKAGVAKEGLAAGDGAFLKFTAEPFLFNLVY